MPSPQLGILTNEDDAAIKTLLDKINSSVRVVVKEPSIKVGVAKESLDDDKIAGNALAVYSKILDNLPRGLDQIRNIKIKFTMSKPVLVE